MDEIVDKGFKKSLGLLFSISEFEIFYRDFSLKNKIESKDGLYFLTETFRKYLSEKRDVTDDENILFKHIIECAENEIYANSKLKISIVNKVKIPSEDFLRACWGIEKG